MALPQANAIKDGILADPLEILSKPSPSKTRLTQADIKDVEYVGSYNWLDRQTPTILVPGSPDEWVQKRMPFRLGRDTGIVMTDQNGYRMPGAPLLPLIVAVNIKAGMEVSSKKFKWPEVDFVTDRNNLRKIMRWINANPGEEQGPEFRVDMQLAGKKTVLLNRFSRNVKEMASFGFGHNFEDAVTKPAAQCEEGVGHHRITKYDFGGLKMVVRYEVDAYLAPGRYAVSPQRSSRSPSSSTVDDLTSTFANVSVASRSRLSHKDATYHSGLTVYPVGSWSVPQSSIVEVTSRSFRNYENINWAEVYPQLFLSQTPNLYIGLHRQGTFTQLVKENLHSESGVLKRVHQTEQPNMKILRWLLGYVQDLLVKRGKNARLSLVCEGGVLGVYERMTDEDYLPKEIMGYF